MISRLGPWAVAVGLAAAVFARSGAARLDAQWAALAIVVGGWLVIAPPRRPTAAPWLLLALWGGAGLLAWAVSDGAPDGFIHWATRDAMFLAGWLVAAELRDRVAEGPAGLPWLGAGAILAAVLPGWLQVLGLRAGVLDAFGDSDPTGGLGLSNFTAEWAIVASGLLAAWWIRRDDRAAKAWAGLAAVVVGGFAVAAAARTAIVAAIASVAAPLVFGERRNARLILSATLMAGGVVAVLMLSQDGPFRYRMMLIDHAVRIAVDAPLGVGPGRFSEGVDRVLSPALDQRSWEIENAITHAHNLAAEGLAERGWLGLTALMGLIAWWLRRASRAQGTAEAWLLAGSGAWWSVSMGSLASAVGPIWFLGGVALGATARFGEDPGRAPPSGGWPARLIGLILLSMAVPAWHAAQTARLERASIAFLRADRFAEAEEALRLALRRDPDAPLLHYRLAQVLLLRGDLAEAIGEFERAANARPGWSRPLEARTLAAAEIGAFGEVLVSAAAWRALPGWHDPMLWHAAASAAWATGRRSEAKEWIEQGLAEHPGEPVLLRLRASIAALEFRWLDAAADYEAVAASPAGTPQDTELAGIARRNATR